MPAALSRISPPGPINATATFEPQRS